MASLKNCWMDYVRKQTARTASDPKPRIKLMAYVVLLLFISSRIPQAESGLIACGPCVHWAAGFCLNAVAAGSVCAAVASFPPLLCSCLLTMGGGACVLAAGSCAALCLAPTP